MPDQSTPNTSEKPRRIPTEVLVALFGVIGVAITAYFGYKQARLPFEAQATTLALTTTAEHARVLTLTALAGSTGTATATVTPSATQTQATFTPTITGTPTTFGQPAGEKYCVNVRSVYVRTGPGSDFGVLGGMTFEDCLYFDARAEDEVQGELEGTPFIEKVTWLRLSQLQPQVAALEGGWVRADLLRPEDFHLLPLITLTPTTTPSPTPSPSPTPLG